METQRLILRKRLKEEFNLGKFGSKYWDLVSKDNQEVMGYCGFHTWDKDAHQAEMACELYKKYRKNGYMLEALLSMIAFAFDKMKLEKIEAYIKIKNTPSKKLILKLGFTPEESTPENLKNPNYIEYFSLRKTDFLK